MAPNVQITASPCLNLFFSSALLLRTILFTFAIYAAVSKGEVFGRTEGVGIL